MKNQCPFCDSIHFRTSRCIFQDITLGSRGGIYYGEEYKIRETKLVRCFGCNREIPDKIWEKWKW